MIAWAAFLLLLHIQTWWTMFGMQAYDDWNFLQFSIVLLQPIVLFLLSVLIFPSATSPETDTRLYFRQQRRWFFGLFLAVVVVSLVKDAVRSELPDRENLAFHGAYGAIALAGLFIRDERVQHGLAYTALTLFVIYIGLLFAQL